MPDVLEAVHWGPESKGVPKQLVVLCHGLGADAYDLIDLATVKDERSMADAKAALEKQTPKYAELARKANALPKPPPPEVVKQFQEDQVIIQATLRHLHTQIDRVSKLPGGEEFMKQFRSNSQGLMPAVQP